MSIKNKKNEYMLDIINYAIEKCPDILIESGEEIYHAQLVHAALSGGEKSIFLVAGPSASGKTTTAYKLREELMRMKKNAVVVSMDDFYKHRTDLPIIDGKPNAEVIESLEIDSLTSVMDDIIRSGKAKLPSYDFVTGRRTDGVKEIEIGKNGVMIIEGIHGLNPRIHSGISTDLIHKIYVSPHSGFALDGRTVITKRNLRFIRRLVRDFWSRGSDAEKTFSMWDEVCRCEDEFIRPLAADADSTIDTTHACEPALIQKQAVLLLSAIKETSPYYDKARFLRKSLCSVKKLDISYLPEKSLLNEFIERKNPGQE